MAPRSETISKPQKKRSSLSLVKIIFSLIGLVSITLVLRSYGLTKLFHDIELVGWWSIPIALTFVPTLFCYSIAWQLVTHDPRPKAKRGSLLRRQLFFFRTTIISIAWNNLSPFVKILGEPIKVMLLEKEVGRNAALRSVVLYNMMHLIGAMSAFLLAAILIPALYPVSHSLRFASFSLVAIFCVICLCLYFLPWLPLKRVQRKRWRGLRATSYWLRWSMQKIRYFYRNHRFALVAAICMEILSRFVEGLTLFTAFHAIGAAIPIRSAAFLDVGRALLDNVFFFIPYQVGSREFGVGFLMRSVLHLPAAGYVTATLLYRMVEIFWMLVGYILWIKPKSSAKSSI